MLVFNIRSAFDSSRRVDVADDLVSFLVRVAELEERSRHGVVHDLDHAPANQFLVLHQRQIRLHTSCVAIHHEANCAGGGEHGDLRVAIAEFFAVGESLVPALTAGGDELG